MKAYVHARLSREDRAALVALKKATGLSESAMLRHGLRLVLKEMGRTPSALALAGRSVGKFKKGPKDLASNKRHLTGFGE